MKKIVITGGLGYIGTELCKIYSGESWNNQITVIDNRFISERVNQLRNWNMNFVHADIRDSDAVKKYLNEADVVHHLAGVTDVARTKEESNPDKDKELNEVAEKGTEVVLSETSKNCKIIFPLVDAPYPTTFFFISFKFSKRFLNIFLCFRIFA